MFNEIFANKAVTVPVFAWFIAQLLKFIVDFIKNKRVDFKQLVGSGGMPSSHSVFTTSLATVLGRLYGFDSGFFAISFAFAMVVMADAAGVRRAAGKQAEVLNKLINSHESINLDDKLKELIGHTPFQVIIGAIIGILFGIVYA